MAPPAGKSSPTRTQQADAALAGWLRRTPAEASAHTEPARDKSFQRFLDEIPEEYDYDERVRRAEELRKIHMRTLARRRHALARQAAQLDAEIDAHGAGNGRGE